MRKGRAHSRILEYYPFVFVDMVECDGYIWFAANSLNGLFRMNYENGEIEYLGKFPTKKKGYLCNAVAYYENRLYFISGMSKEIFEYDIQLKTFTVYEVDYGYDVIGFYGVGQYQKYLFFWSNVKYDIIRFDMEEKKFKIIKVLDIEEEKETEEDLGDTFTFYLYKSVALWRGYCIVGNHLYIPSPKKNIVLDVDMEKSTAEVQVVLGMEGYLTICYDGKNFWLSGAENCLVTWNANSKETVTHQINNDIPIKEALLCVYNQSQIFYSLSDSSSEILVLNINNMEFRSVLDPEEERQSWGEAYPFKVIMLKKMNGIIWAFNSQNYTLQTFEGGKRKVYRQELVDGIEDFVHDHLDDYFIRSYENLNCGVNEFIVYISESNFSKFEKICHRNIGKQIKKEIDKQIVYEY